MARDTFTLVFQLLAPRRFPGLRRYVQRLVVGLVFLPALLLLQMLHWLGFLLDELLFRSYRGIAIREPVFVLGAPRSGTTRLHRLLAADPRFTTFATWECLFAPSITERRLWLALASLDRTLGRPAGRLLSVFGHMTLGWIDDKHPLGLAEPEEDYFCFLPILRCFILVLPFPGAERIWRMATFDRDLSNTERRRLLDWYRRCLQKHLYVHGPDRTLLSKNAAFAGMARSLATDYPDARFIVCERDAVAVVASQFNALTDGMRLFGIAPDDPDFRRRLLDCIDFYYANLDAMSASLPPSRCARAAMEQLANQPAGLLSRLYSQLRMPDRGDLAGRLRELEHSPTPHVPARVPSLALWGLESAELTRRFAPWTQQEKTSP